MNRFIGSISPLSPHFISLRPAIYRTQFLIDLVNQCSYSSENSLSAADFEIKSSLICQRDNILAYGFNRKNSLLFEEAISNGMIKPDISKQLRNEIKPFFSSLNNIQIINYYYYYLLKEVLDLLVSRRILKYLIEKGFFWRYYGR